MEDFSGSAFMRILRTGSSPTTFAEKAVGPVLGRVEGDRIDQFTTID